MTYKISIIVPVFNAEKDIGRMINSVINQTIAFEDIELILVDDKSKDNTQNIIRSYSDKYDNIKPIFLDKNSGGASVPRNTGLKNASAPYLMFIDADDSIIPDYCETLYNTIIEEKADIVYCRECMEMFDGIYAYSNNSKERFVVDDPLDLRLTAWANIFKASLIKENNITFPKYNDDVNFAIQAYTKADKIIKLPNYCGYVYKVETTGEPSLTHNMKIESFTNTIKGYTIMKNYLEENNIPKDKTFAIKLPTFYFMYFKLDASRDEKIKVLKDIYAFEKSLHCNIKLNSKILNFLNILLLKQHYNMLWLFGEIGKKMYNQHKLKNFVYRKFFGLKKVVL